MNGFKKFWPYLVALIVFAAVAGIYMSPVFDGRTIATSDGIQGRAAVRECVEYYEQTGDRSWWTGSMFSGMPNYQIGGGKYAADLWLKPVKDLLLWGHRNVIAIVLIYCLGFFALLRSMRVDRWLSIVGALATAFSTYFFIIIGANHHSKTSTLALMAAVVAGFYLIFHGHRKTGVVLTMLCSAAGFYPHPQMAYYMCFILGAFWLAELTAAFTARTWKAFGMATLLFAAAFGIGVGTGTAATFANLEYAQETMRGGHSDLEKADNETNRTSGLDLDYATAWSYGIEETWTFLVPNYMGGSSNYNVGKDSDLCRAMVRQGVPRRSAEQFAANVPTYWGDQPFTAGPVYMGAIVCFLFVLGLLIVQGPYRWALLGVTVLSICLSWGSHWMGLTRFFFDVVPMYNKFRAVSSILVIAEVTMPLLGFLALKRLADARKAGEDLGFAIRPIAIAGGVTAGLAVLVALVGGTCVSPSDAQMAAQLPEWLMDEIVLERQSMLTSDAWRSALFVVLGTGLTLLYAKFPGFKTSMFALALGVLVVADLWPVNKRYMNDNMFSKAAAFDDAFREQAWEKQILATDTDPHFRVFNLTTSPFNDARTSYRMKSIGGYSAAKLRRYQDLIDQHLSKMHRPVIDMLNAKYFITQGQDGTPVAQLNPDAMGNAWFVDRLFLAETPNTECDALMEVDLRTTAVVGRDYASFAEASALPTASEYLMDSTSVRRDSSATVSLTHYTPRYIDYEAHATQPGTIVFSEIFYPHGWVATVDGVEVEHYRVNYMLRALNVDAGTHKIRFEFRPESVAKGNTLSMIFVVAMYLIVALCIVLGIRDLRRK